MNRLAILILLAASCGLAFEVHRSEIFDTSGMPLRATTFLEQQIFEMIASHPTGDLTDAARVQSKLGKYYADKGDQARSQAAFRLAAAAQGTPERPQSRAPEPVISRAPVRAKPPEPSRGSGGLSGNYFGYEGRLLHTWEFSDSGSFLHTWIASGAGTSVRNSERGTFLLSGDTLEIRISSTAGGFATPGVGGRTTVSGGGAEESSEVRRLRFVREDNGIVLDGVKLKPRSW